jgi:hypothetical protein
VFTAVVARVDPISPSDLYAQLLSFEQHAHLQAHFSSGTLSSAMTANRGCGFSGRGSGGSDRGHGPSHGHGRTSRGRGRSSGGSRPQCQVCLKIGHTADRCWHCYEEDYASETRNAATTSGPGVDQAWYTDSRSTDHITRELDQLMMHDPYTGTDQIHAANGSGMAITQIGTSLIPTSDRDLVLNNVLHVPATHKNLISVHCFTLDNNTFIKFHPYFYLIKDQK